MYIVGRPKPYILTRLIIFREVYIPIKRATKIGWQVEDILTYTLMTVQNFEDRVSEKKKKRERNHLYLRTILLFKDSFRTLYRIVIIDLLICIYVASFLTHNYVENLAGCKTTHNERMSICCTEQRGSWIIYLLKKKKKTHLVGLRVNFVSNRIIIREPIKRETRFRRLICGIDYRYKILSLWLRCWERV